MCSCQKVLGRQPASSNPLLQRLGGRVDGNGRDSPFEKSVSKNDFKSIIFSASAALRIKRRISDAGEK